MRARYDRLNDLGQPHRVSPIVCAANMRTNLHSSQAYSKFAYAQHPEWMGLLQSTEEPLLRLRDTAIHTVGLLIFNCLSVRPPLHFQEPEVLRPIINLRVRAHRHFKFPDMEGQAPTLRMDAITDNDFPNGRSTLLPETLFLVIRRYTEGNNGRRWLTASTEAESSMTSSAKQQQLDTIVTSDA